MRCVYWPAQISTQEAMGYSHGKFWELVSGHISKQAQFILSQRQAIALAFADGKDEATREMLKALNVQAGYEDADQTKALPEGATGNGWIDFDDKF